MFAWDTDRHESRTRKEANMRTTAGSLLTACLLVGTSAIACAMTPARSPALPCTVTNAARLPNALGGEDGLCEEFRRAAADRLPAGSSVELRVVSDFHLTAVLTLAEGRTLPPVTASASDRQLSAKSIQLLADAIAAQVSQRSS
jgi:hypothetical protein